MNKRGTAILSALLAALLLLTAMPVMAETAADPFGAYEEPIEVHIGLKVDPAEQFPEGDSPENNQYTRYVKEKLNVDVIVDWSAATADYDQKVGLAIASNDLPDGFVVKDVAFRQMVKSDQLADLRPAYDMYASDTMKKMLDSSNGKAIENVSYGDSMYALSSLSDGDMLLTWIRKDWLDKLGLPEPKTLDDLIAVARAFVEKDPGGNGPGKTIGITGQQNGGALYATFLTSGPNLYGFDNIFNASNSYPGWWLDDGNGGAVYGSILPETKTALSTLAGLYKDGIIDPEMGIRKDAAEPIKAGLSGIFCGGWWMGYAALPDTIKNNPEANFQAYGITAGEGEVFKPHASAASPEYVVVRKGYEHPELAVKLNNLFIRDETTFDLSKANASNFPLRTAFGMADESQYSVKALREVLAGTKTPADFTEPAYKLLADDLKNITTVKKEPYDNMDIQYWDFNANPSAWSRLYSLMVGWKPLIDQPYEAVYSLSYSTTPTTEKRWTNLKKMEDETFMKIIMGSASIDEFDKFVSDWKAQGGDQITQEVTEFVQSK